MQSKHCSTAQPPTSAHHCTGTPQSLRAEECGDTECVLLPSQHPQEIFLYKQPNKPFLRLLYTHLYQHRCEFSVSERLFWSKCSSSPSLGCLTWGGGTLGAPVLLLPWLSVPLQTHPKHQRHLLPHPWGCKKALSLLLLSRLIFLKTL